MLIFGHCDILVVSFLLLTFDLLLVGDKDLFLCIFSLKGCFHPHIWLILYVNQTQIGTFYHTFILLILGNFLTILEIRVTPLLYVVILVVTACILLSISCSPYLEILTILVALFFHHRYVVHPGIIYVRNPLHLILRCLYLLGLVQVYCMLD